MTKKKPPSKTFKRHLQEAQSLTSGKNIKVPWTKNKLILAKLTWETDKEVNIETYQVIECSSDSLIDSLIDSLLNGTDFDDFDYDYNHDRCIKKIKNSAEFKKFNARIQAVCREADKWEKTYKDFSWEVDVLDRIEQD